VLVPYSPFNLIMACSLKPYLTLISAFMSFFVMLVSILYPSVYVTATPPPAPAIFVGREDFVERILSLIETVKSARIAILGPGGMGKTATALTILHNDRMVSRFTHRYFVSCHAATTPMLLIINILSVLGAQHAGGGDVLTILHDRLAAMGPALLVLDNFETPWEESGMQVKANEILERIASVEQIRLIVTMRGTVRPPGVIWTEPTKLPVLGPLSPEASKALFLAGNPMELNEKEEGNLKVLLQELDYVPLAIVLVAQVGTGQSCSLMLRRWRKEKTSCLQTEGSKSTKLSSIDVSISLSLNALSITENPDAIKLLSVLCHLPDGVIGWENSLELIAPSFDNRERLAAVLLRVSLVFIGALDSMRVLSPIRHYILRNYPADDDKLKDLETFYLVLISEKTSIPVGPDYPEAMARLIPENGNITSLLQNGLRTHPYEELVKAAYDISLWLCHAQPSVDLLEELLKHPDLLKATKLDVQCILCLGNSCVRLNDYAVATAKLREALKKFIEVGDKQGAARCLRSIGDIVRTESKYPESIELYNQAMEYYTEIGDRLGMAQVYQSMGNGERMQNQHQKAKETLTKAQEIFEEVGNVLGAVHCLLTLGDVLRKQNRYQEAIETLEDAQDQFEEIGDRLGWGWCLQTVGEIFRRQNKYAEAKKKMVEAEEKFSGIGNKMGMTWCIQSFGDMFRMQNYYPEAIEQLKLAEKEFHKILYRLGATRCQRALGEIYLLQNQYPKAKRTVQKALEQYTEIGYKLGMAHCLRNLGDCARMQNRFSEAKEKLDQALALFIEIEDAPGIGWTRNGLGILFCLQSQFEDAKDQAEQGLQQFTPLGDQLGAAWCLRTLGNILREQKQYAKAKETLEEAKEKSVKINDRLGTAMCLKSLSDIAQKMENYPGALKFLMEAESLFKEIGVPEEVEQCMQCQKSLEAVDQSITGTN
jgi:tetratricopeptide (TPR) repeat protein